MSDNVLIVYSNAMQLFGRIIKSNPSTSVESRVVEACGKLERRISRSLTTIVLLYANAAEHDWSIDGETILRAMFDAELQAIYILQPADEKERGQRAAAYLDFECVERKSYNEKIYVQNNPRAKRFKQTGKANGGPGIIKQEYECVKKRFQESNGKFRLFWHPFATLGSLAKSLGRLDEYQYFVGLLNESVHTSAIGWGLRIRGVSSGYCFRHYQ